MDQFDRFGEKVQRLAIVGLIILAVTVLGFLVLIQVSVNAAMVVLLAGMAAIVVVSCMGFWYATLRVRIAHRLRRSNPDALPIGMLIRRYWPQLLVAALIAAIVFAVRIAAYR
jgi:hypothetical protein